MDSVLSREPTSVLVDRPGSPGPGCRRTLSNRRKAKKIVKLLRVDQSLKVMGYGTKNAATLPPAIPCGSLRKVVRSMYAPGLSPVQELSIKTSAKAEGDPCLYCRDLAEESYLMAYQKARLVPQGVDPRHLESFEREFRGNVPQGWNQRKSPYVPNGHATKEWSRSKGGNWNTEPYSEDCRVELVYSSGKPRVVTLFAERNVAVLTPLHHSLYAFLRGRNWLLVGEPTAEKLRHLKRGTFGSEWLSFDYESATDNIKTAYVRRAVEVLIDKGEGLSVEEVDCLRCVGNLRISGSLAESGQPMGSPMSFPLLCLINKTVLDLALSDLLIEGSVSMAEYAAHRCLINGDDLLTRSTSGGDLVAAVVRNGSQVGLRVNRDKTMRSSVWAEINSTAFVDVGSVYGGFDESVKCEWSSSGPIALVKKTNVSALWMGAEVRDVLGFAWQASRTARGFGRMVSANASRLARQKTKTVGYLNPVAKGVLLRSPKLRRALTSGPSSSVPEPEGLLVTEPTPCGFDVTREESFAAVTREVARLKRFELWRPLVGHTKAARKARLSVKTVELGPCTRKQALKVLEWKRPVAEERELSVLVRYWYLKIKERLLAEDERSYDPCSSGYVRFDGESCSPFTQIRLAIREYKRKCAQIPLPAVQSAFGAGWMVPDPFSEGDGEIRFCDE